MKIDFVWIIYKSNSQSARQKAISCSDYLKSLGVRVTAVESGLECNPFPSLLKETSRLPNLAVILGGDGTVLGAARHLSIHKIPILSFNVGGNLGFLTHDQQLLENKSLWEKLDKDQFAIQSRMMLQGKLELSTSIDHGQKTEDLFWALNDIYFRSYRDEVSPTCSLELEIDGEPVDIYKGDGLILATPTGSTAYAMGTGGPILHPSVEAIVVSPICPMSLSSRTIVVPAGSTLIIKPVGNKNRRVKIWQDGVGKSLIQEGEKCLIQKARHNALMILLEQSSSYYKTLTQKLHWAGNLVNDSTEKIMRNAF